MDTNTRVFVNWRKWRDQPGCRHSRASVSLADYKTLIGAMASLALAGLNPADLG